MSKPNRYRTDKDDDRETEPSHKGHHGLALLILILLAGVVVWFWLARDPEAREEFSNRMANLRESAINLAADLMSRTTTPPSPQMSEPSRETACPERRPNTVLPSKRLRNWTRRLRNRGRCSRAEPKYAALWPPENRFLPMRGARTIKSCASPLSTIWLHGSVPTMSPQRPRAGAEGFPQACREQISVMGWG